MSSAVITLIWRFSFSINEATKQIQQKFLQRWIERERAEVVAWVGIRPPPVAAALAPWFRVTLFFFVILWFPMVVGCMYGGRSLFAP